MKTITCTLISAMLGIANFSQATIRTADNKPGAPNDGVHNFSTLQAAIDASLANDTVYIQGSAIVYNSTSTPQTFTVNRKLVFIGPGHNPAVQNPLSAQLGNIDILQTGSGSKFIGINFSGLLTFRNLTNTITVQRCKFASGASGISSFNTTGSTITDWIIEGCIFTKNGVDFANVNGTCNNLVFRNNIFNGQIYALSSNPAFNSSLVNNVFINCTYGPATLGISNVKIENNIFYGSKPGTDITGVTFNKNISFQNGTYTFPSGDNFYIDPVFVSYNGGAFAYNQDFHLSGNSPHNTGTDNTDLGVYGGNNIAFSMTGEPAFPQITALTNNGSSTVLQNGTLNITLSGRSIQ